ncbi:ABC transporter ATP-binding protein [Rothia sp. CCM 9416]|uniref:ABC transporter ATP-binding protein n=1 Tax=Rothia sp. CCM 9416 TaxID=3402655 RepID=UPI003AE94A0D
MKRSPLLTNFKKMGNLFDKKAKRTLVIIAILSSVLAISETIAIVLVLPLINLAMGQENAIPGFLKNSLEALGIDQPSGQGLVLVIALILIFITKDLLTMWFNWRQSGFLANQRVKTSSRLMEQFMSMPWGSFRQRTTAEMIRTMNDATAQVYSLVVGGFLGLSNALITTLAILIALLIAVPLPTLAILVYFSVASFIYGRIIRSRTLAAGEQIMTASVQGYLRALHGLGAFKEITLRHTEEYFTTHYRQAAREGAYAARFASFLSSIPKYLLEILFILAVGGLLAYMFLSADGPAALGAMALLVAAGFRLLPNIALIISSTNNISLGSKSLDVVLDELYTQYRPLPTQHEYLERLPFHHEIELKDVHFSFPGAEEETIKGVNLKIPFGTSVAFVGGSGAGKTTMVDLILGLLPATQGQVLADGVDIQSHVRSWQENVSMVAQDVYMSGWSLQQNIVFDSDTTDPVRLKDAVRRAQLDDLVASLPKGLDSECGEGGSRLSGGQRQRVGIARALYRNPALLVLDEATSALDNLTEKKITETIDRLHGEVTVVVVAHRLSTVKNADLIVYMKDGKVSATGSFVELQKKSPEFAKLVELGSLDRA